MSANSDTEILIQRIKQLQPEEIALKIEQFDRGLCTQTFLSELRNLLPTPEQVGSLLLLEYGFLLLICRLESSTSIATPMRRSWLVFILPIDLWLNLFKSTVWDHVSRACCTTSLSTKSFRCSTRFAVVFTRTSDGLLPLPLQGAIKLQDAGTSLQHAVHFKELLNVRRIKVAE